MKRFIPALLLVLASTNLNANSFTGLWYGAGLANTNNYNIGNSFGLTYYFGVAYGVGVGFSAFQQKFNMYYDEDVNRTVGTSLRFTGSYAFISPMFVSHVTRTGGTQAYVNAGIGFKTGGYDSVHKWSDVTWGAPGAAYDSLIDNSKNMKSMVFRVGGGFTHYFQLRGKLKLALSEEVGLLPGSLTSLPPVSNSQSNAYTRYYSPVYFSVKLGITFRTPAPQDGKPGSSRKRIR